MNAPRRAAVYQSGVDLGNGRRVRVSPLALAVIAVACGARSSLLPGESEFASGGRVSTAAGANVAAGSLGTSAGSFNSFGGQGAAGGAPDAAGAGGRSPAARCEIDGAGYESGVPNPENPCELCQPEISATSWVAAPSASCVRAVSVGLLHACAIRGGKAHCWGRNDSGQLGDGGGATYRATPVQVAGLGETVTTVSAGGWHSCAIVKGPVNTPADQAAFCWGGNNLGQLGNGSMSGSASAVPVQGLSSNVTSISVGLGFSCAVFNGAALCWGGNVRGELGNGSTASSNFPVAVQGLDTDVTAIAAGAEHVCALQRGVAYCWGRNSDGQLGNGTTNDSAVPVRVQGLLSVSQIVAGGVGTCAIVNGADWCWGSNLFGQIGTDGGGIRTQPVPIVPLSNRVTAIAIGEAETCALRDGAALCWGNVATGLLGSDVLVGSIPGLPAPFGPPGAGITAISAFSYNGCLVQRGSAYCWGWNQYGQLGNNSQVTSVNPVLVQFP